MQCLKKQLEKMSFPKLSIKPAEPSKKSSSPLVVDEQLTGKNQSPKITMGPSRESAKQSKLAERVRNMPKLKNALHGSALLLHSGFVQVSGQAQQRVNKLWFGALSMGGDFIIDIDLDAIFNIAASFERKLSSNTFANQQIPGVVQRIATSVVQYMVSNASEKTGKQVKKEQQKSDVQKFLSVASCIRRVVLSPPKMTAQATIFCGGLYCVKLLLTYLIAQSAGKPGSDEKSSFKYILLREVAIYFLAFIEFWYWTGSQNDHQPKGD